MAKEDFYVGDKPPISFTLNVIATDLPMEDKNFKIKIEMDFVPKIIDKQKKEAPNFNGTLVHSILNFISNKLIKKVIEFIYYDRTNDDLVRENNKKLSRKKLPKKRLEDERMQLPYNFKTAMDIYGERLDKKKKLNSRSLSYANYKEDIIEGYVEKYFSNGNRKIWDKERNVSRVAYTILSAPTMSVESRTPVNGDKKLPR